MLYDWGFYKQSFKDDHYEVQLLLDILSKYNIQLHLLLEEIKSNNLAWKKKVTVLSDCLEDLEWTIDFVKKYDNGDYYRFNPLINLRSYKKDIMLMISDPRLQTTPIGVNDLKQKEASIIKLIDLLTTKQYKPGFTIIPINLKEGFIKSLNSNTVDGVNWPESYWMLGEILLLLEKKKVLLIPKSDIINYMLNYCKFKGKKPGYKSIQNSWNKAKNNDTNENKYKYFMAALEEVSNTFDV